MGSKHRTLAPNSLSSLPCANRRRRSPSPCASAGTRLFTGSGRSSIKPSASSGYVSGTASWVRIIDERMEAGRKLGTALGKLDLEACCEEACEIETSQACPVLDSEVLTRARESEDS